MCRILCRPFLLQLRHGAGYSIAVCLFSARQPPSGPWPTHSRDFWITHNEVPHSFVLLWTSDHLVAETYTWQHKTLITDKRPCPRWDSNPQSQQTSGPRPMLQTAQPAGLALQGATCSKYLKKAGKEKHTICEHKSLNFIFTTNKNTHTEVIIFRPGIFNGR